MQISPISGNEYIHGLLSPFFKRMQYWKHGSRRITRQSYGQPDVAREYNEMDTHEPDASSRVREDKSVKEYVPRHGRQRTHEGPQREVKDFTHTIEKAAQFSNNLLARHQSRYRFCVYEESEEVFVDLVILDAKGAVTKEIVTRITHDDFLRWVNDIRDAEGLIIDEEV